MVNTFCCEHAVVKCTICIPLNRRGLVTSRFPTSSSWSAVGNSYSYPPVFKALGKCLHSTGWFQLVEQEVDLTLWKTFWVLNTESIHLCSILSCPQILTALCQFLCLMIHDGTTVMPEEFPISYASKVMRGGMVVNMEHYGVAILYLRLV